MEKYKVKPEDLKEKIKDFPIEIVQKMIDYHIKEDGKTDEIDMCLFRILPEGAFNWRNTEEGLEFWDRVIHHHDFDLFFAKYPKAGKNDNKETKETIEIDGKKYKKEEVINRINELKEIE